MVKMARRYFLSCTLTLKYLNGLGIISTMGTPLNMILRCIFLSEMTGLSVFIEF